MSPSAPLQSHPQTETLNTKQPTTTESKAPPPPYTPTAAPPKAHTHQATLSPHPDTDTSDTIEIDATTTVSGTANTVATSTDLVLAASRVAGALYAALDKQMRHENDSAKVQGQRPRPLKIRVSCGVRVVGARNVVGGGSAGLTAAAVAASSAGARGKSDVQRGYVSSAAGGFSVRCGGKRKAEDEARAGRADKAVKTEGV